MSCPKNQQMESEWVDGGYWAKPSQIVAMNEHAKPIAFLFVAAFICFQLFTLPDGVQTKDLWSWVRLVLSLLLFMVATVYALKFFLPCIAGRRCRLKLSALSYKLGDPIRMTLCIGAPLPEGGEAHVILRCQRPPKGEETESGKMFIKLFELKKCVSCPVWPEQGGDLQIPLEFVISEVDRALWDQEEMSSKNVTWAVWVKITTLQASYERGFVLPVHA
jgi:hypothetical protein